ncbi:plasmid replication/partition related protein [Comamonas serinivorans]|uniref:Plasmid replication/partition related protein n=1 Tax=Comamonas serinivorans TaxID=1082851 RepID=A0A1Y0ENM6_9BURK|nr:plasmid replication/partition related protein [Comamonas serinivorans]ARU04902.1 plasmid replication/partition related protein [Comamonas serinivorans]
MDIVVNEDLKAYIDPLTPDEHAALERSILAEGCRDALVLWGDLLVDGHNRYGICQKHGLPFSTVQATQFQTLEDVHLWMIDQHLGRRSISDFQRGVLALRKRDILESRLKAAQTQAAAPAPSQATDPADHGDDAPVAGDPPFDMDGPDRSGAAPAEAAAPTVAPVDTRLLTSREALAKAARISSSQVRMIEAIQSQAAPEVVAAVKSGDITLSTAAVVASLPADEQVQAAQGGAKELRQAAKRVREAKRKPKPESDTGDESQTDAADASDGAEDTVDSLRARVRELEAENAELRAQLALLQGAALA